MTVTRFAPSPTGYLHIGGLRTALFSWLTARHNNGKFLLRIEDTDMARNSEEAKDAILKAFEWVGMSHDGEVVYQSKRFDLYKKYIDQLLEEGKAYKCYMTKEELNALREEQMAKKERTRYDGRYRDFTGTPPEGVKPVIRIKAPQEGTISFVDGVKGAMNIAANEVDDFIIARSDGTPTYNFVVAIDDALMGLTDVIRGDDHLYNTPKQIVVYNALGFSIPNFYHVAMINNEQGKKLSKRDGATDVMEYKALGFLPEALLNFLVRLGWSHGDQEIFSVEEMIEQFDPKDINKSASNYNLDKLLWLNAHYIKNKSNSELAELLKEFGVDISEHDKLEMLLDATKERGKTLVELAEQIKLILTAPTDYDEKAVKKAFKGEAKEILTDFIAMLQTWEKPLHLPVDYHEVMEKIVAEKEIGFGKIGMPLRVSLLGSMTGAGMDEVMAIIGVDETIERIERAVSTIA
ncbi:glutamate--tRNA ligase [Sulfurovum sp. NBC37-1]|uniref:Glutamate--tRNA ligase 1 n=1 Tax=Sulfurovum sp. (strain NBC37-1) TaxID=387093 RepID=SYE1_SULNB|nr:glutamate--tRNA ligase [Sulfurovum sp. NBC37-1]A6Q6F9.1 RecName: Full=Glutamate--tRNA ligase 1; AltName: Full=Glutamyl-tRNA synthetase 1; Short=GluRS 1 [Sulfurovum sp. NBC37-1]BAF71068.1 glutamyl-tRNA synthetase [Sulfurovum sp. NBC37-1]